MGRIQSWPATRTTGELGVAVQSHWFSVGPLCAWARAGSARWPRSRSSSRPTGRTRSTGSPTASTPPQALGELLAADPLAAVRQVAVIDAARPARRPHRARTASRTPAHVTGEHHSCQANMMARDTVPGRDVGTRSAGDGRAADRLLAALDAAEAEGGDVRGRQSAAMLVVPAEGEPWRRTRRPARRGPPRRRSTSSAGCSPSSAPTTSRARATSCSPRAAPTRPASSTRGGGARARTRTSCSSGPASPAPRRETSTPAWRRSAAPPRSNPNWLVLLDAALAGVRAGGRSGAVALSR